MKISTKQINNLDNILQNVKPISISTTLSANAWKDNKITISNTNIKAASFCILSVTPGAMESMFTEFSEASAVCLEQTDGSLTIKALGKIPEHDITVNIVTFQTVKR